MFFQIPVHIGSKTAMVVPYVGDSYHGCDGFNGVSFPEQPDVSKVSGELAVDAIRRLAREHPGEITMVCLAPLTNLALALKVDVEATNGLKELVLMGGNVEGVGNTTIAAEFNFHADPEAAHVVMEVSKFPITVVSWELCYKYIDIPMVITSSICM